MDFDNIHRCAICEAEVNFGVNPLPNGDEVVMFNHHTDENEVDIFCSKKCQNQFATPLSGCIVCDQVCLTDRWFVHVKFVNLGGWTSVKAVCSEECNRRVLTEDAVDIDIRYVCWNCKKMHEKKPPNCGRCKLAYYCNQNCQRQHWSSHKTDCKK
jgi:hypothetical protein